MWSDKASSWFITVGNDPRAMPSTRKKRTSWHHFSNALTANLKHFGCGKNRLSDQELPSLIDTHINIEEWSSNKRVFFLSRTQIHKNILTKQLDLRKPGLWSAHYSAHASCQLINCMSRTFLIKSSICVLDDKCVKFVLRHLPYKLLFFPS